MTGARRRLPRRQPVARERAIGIFDSGIGGLTVVRALTKLLPSESLVYLGDTGRYPYGTKSADVVRRYSFENTDFLVDKQVKMLVVACNTSTAVALEALQQRVAVPVVGVIEPGARAAVRASRNRKIGVIGTEATIRSGEYTRALRGLRPDLEIYARACPLFVPLAEEGWVDNEVAERAARLYLTSLAHSGIDTLILGCTHYPLLKRVIRATMSSTVRLIDSGVATAATVREVLAKEDLLRRRGGGETSFFVTDAPERFVKVGARFLGAQVDSAVQLDR
ncbi:MAG TPA: glutamate racemase [Candidatus Dormibacteraeota bacterium]|nr:glutamate racemase [Candidatus Dormibacteraeota bacterium]